MVFRWLRLFATLALLLVVGGPRPPTLQPLYAERIAIVSSPVTIAAGDPARRRIGALTLVGGWTLTSRSRQFGGWSAIDVAGDRVTAIGDAGSVLRFRLGRFGNVYDASIAAMPKPCGRTDDKIWRDTESLTHDPVSGDWWVGYEWRNTICRISSDFAQARAVAAPTAMQRWSRIAGPESMLRLADGRFVVIAEGDPKRAATRPLLVFDRDPTDPWARVARLRWRPPTGYDPTDIAALPDGRWLVLVRRFSPVDLFTAMLILVDPRSSTGSQVADGIVLARLAPPTIHDNFEGVSVAIERGQATVWLISDSNFLDWQSTYLLKFTIDPAALTVRQRSVRRRPAPLRSSASAAVP